MTDEDLRRIEAELSITLPEAYRAVVRAFPVPAHVGNDETPIWDDAAALIRLNQELRAGKIGKPWPPELFAVGAEDDGSRYALDLGSSDASVFWVDRVLDGEHGKRVPFAQFAEQTFSELRADLEANGVGPKATREKRKAAEDQAVKSEFLGCIVAPVAAFVLLLLVAFAYLWWRG
jgi:hypothetical protein